ncbi:hypothetical protein [Glycomyces xiaoerkulensis]|uniref:hypothetical protein n=1 Tax=Glycomyces xiaoerkulensis TaxID=2038139 RepID=UPI000C261BBF|nr:hypothetical protein [Glycomyces xiaoerkulensis]
MLENTHSATRIATGHPGHPAASARSGHYAVSANHPPGFGSGEPNYEPAHLRHRPGDEWKIGGRPHDPDDPGPYGTPGWRPDRRIGRHRRGELPDPLPETDPTDQEPQRFPRLREDAYRAFIRDSEELHQAHFRSPEPSRAAIRVRWFLRVLLAILYWRVLPFPERPRPAPRRPSPAPDRARSRVPQPRLPQVRLETGGIDSIGARPIGRRSIGGGAG